MARTVDVGLRLRFITAAKKFNLPARVTRPQLVEFSKKHSLPFPQWLTMDKTLVVSRGVYRVPYDRFETSGVSTPEVTPEVKTNNDSPLSCVLSLSTPKSNRTSGSDNARFERALEVAASKAIPRPQKLNSILTDE